MPNTTPKPVHAPAGRMPSHLSAAGWHGQDGSLSQPGVEMMDCDAASPTSSQSLAGSQHVRELVHEWPDMYSEVLIYMLSMCSHLQFRYALHDADRRLCTLHQR